MARRFFIVLQILKAALLSKATPREVPYPVNGLLSGIIPIISLYPILPSPSASCSQSSTNSVSPPSTTTSTTVQWISPLSSAHTDRYLAPEATSITLTSTVRPPEILSLSQIGSEPALSVNISSFESSQSGDMSSTGVASPDASMYSISGTGIIASISASSTGGSCGLSTTCMSDSSTPIPTTPVPNTTHNPRLDAHTIAAIVIPSLAFLAALALGIGYTIYRRRQMAFNHLNDQESADLSFETPGGELQSPSRSRLSATMSMERGAPAANLPSTSNLLFSPSSNTTQETTSMYSQESATSDSMQQAAHQNTFQYASIQIPPASIPHNTLPDAHSASSPAPSPSRTVLFDIPLPHLHETSSKRFIQANY